MVNSFSGGEIKGIESEQGYSERKMSG